jgi:BlaI family transcriptional regulator, penicillinase repressor
VTPAPRRPTDGELAILHVLWDHGPMSVRDVQLVLDREKPTGYTTVLKLMQIMTTKGLVARDDSVRPQIYSAGATREHTQRQLLRDLARRAFGGSVNALVLQALATKRSSAEQMQAIERLLKRFEGGDK